MQLIALMFISSSVTTQGLKVHGFIGTLRVKELPRRHTTFQNLQPRTLIRHRHVKQYSDSINCIAQQTKKRHLPLLQLNADQSSSDPKQDVSPSIIYDYINLMRPITIIQAVGAFLVGHLVILRHNSIPIPIPTIVSIQDTANNLILASLSIYLSYGAGMAMNDCADATLDAEHGVKQSRSIASGRISRTSGWVFCVCLSILSVILSSLATMRNTLSCDTNQLRFVLWSGFNLALMAAYALGMQRIFMIKNIICGWLAVSPLVGAAIFNGTNGTLDHSIIQKMFQLAAIGFPLQVSREILKDIEDMDTDRGKKQTLPLVIGATKSKHIAYGMVGLINIAMVALPHYWKMFASRPPLYAFSVAVGVPMCIRASLLPLMEGQKLLKKSIYVLLFGMIGGLMLQ